MDDRATEQFRTLGESLGHAVARIEGAENHSRSVEQQLASRHDQLATGLQEVRVTQLRFHRRVDWIIAVASGVLILGTVAGAILARDIQANTRVLATMRGDMNVLLAAIDQRLMAPQQALPDSPDPQASTATPPPVVAPPELPEPAAPAVSETPLPPPVSPWETPPAAGARDVNRYFLGQELDLFRQMSLAGNPATGRADSGNSAREQADPVQIITTFSGLQYQIITAGSGRRPRLTDRVVLDYLGKTEEGSTLVDTYTAGTPVTFAMSELMPGWQEALLLMQEGAEWGLYVPPHLAQSGRIGRDDVSDPVPGFYLIRLNAVIEHPANR